MATLWHDRGWFFANKASSHCISPVRHCREFLVPCMLSPVDFLDALTTGMWPFRSSMRRLSLGAAPSAAHADASGEASVGRATACAQIGLQRARLRTCFSAFGQALHGIGRHNRTAGAAATARGRLENIDAAASSGGDTGNRSRLCAFHRHVLPRVREQRSVRHERYSSCCGEQDLVLNPKGLGWFWNAVAGNDEGKTWLPGGGSRGTM